MYIGFYFWHDRTEFDLGTMEGGYWVASIDTSPNDIFSLNVWHHIAVVKHDWGLGPQMRIYIDGDDTGNYDWGTDNMGTEHAPNSGLLGLPQHQYPHGGDGLKGYMDEFRISKGIARWTAPFTPPTSAYAGGTFPGADVICDEEKIHVSAVSNDTLTVTRGTGGTTAKLHSKGSTIYEKLAIYQVEVACHPVSSIPDVYIKQGGNDLIKVEAGTIGMTVYTDKDESGDIGHHAVVEFDDRFQYGQKIAADTGLHNHPGNVSAAITKRCDPTGPAGTGHAMVDGDEDSYYGWSGSGASPAITFSEVELGVVWGQRVYVKLPGAWGGLTVLLNNVGIGLTAPSTGWQNFFSSGGGWNDSVAIAATPGNGGSVSEVYKEVIWYPGPTGDNPADGVNTEAGNSTANLLIADQVYVDVSGFRDDGYGYTDDSSATICISDVYTAGDITGTPSTLLEKPDHIRHHILRSLLGFEASDIDATSFNNIGIIYNGRVTGGYKLGFVLHEVATDTYALMEELDMQTRSIQYESQGKYKLYFQTTPSILPSPDLTITSAMLKEFPVFKKSELADIRNILTATYNRNYETMEYDGSKELRNAASITKYGKLRQEYQFSAVPDLPLMVIDVLTWILYEKRDVRKMVDLSAFWDAILLDFNDIFGLTSNIWTGLVWKIYSLSEDPKTQLIKISGINIVTE